MNRYGVVLYRGNAMLEMSFSSGHPTGHAYPLEDKEFWNNPHTGLPPLLFFETEVYAQAAATELAKKFPGNQFCVCILTEVHRSSATPPVISKLTDQGLLPS